VGLVVAIVASLLVGCDSDGSGMESSDPDGPSGTVTVTLNNVGSSAWTVTDMQGASGVASDGENPTLTLTVGTRYRFVNNGGSRHPIGLQDSSGTYLLAQDRDGSREEDPEISYAEDDAGITFTYTASLASEVATYRCTIHAAMNGAIATGNANASDGEGSEGGGY
jgi:plastocyanin